MSNLKLCPLRVLSIHALKELNVAVLFKPCYGEQCAWWNIDKERCAIAVVAKGLEK